MTRISMTGLTLLALFTNAGNSSSEVTTTTKGKPESVAKALVYTTAGNTGYRLTLTDTLQFENFEQPLETDVCVFIDKEHRFQTFLGIGGALTDAAAETFARLPEKKQQEVLQAYYSREKGIGYTLARTNMNSCDFSSDSYTYIKEGDKSLNSFNIKHDEQYRIPLIKQAIAATGGKLLLYVSPWSPPAFMKDNNSLFGGGKLKAEYYQSWANYYIKFIKAYEKEGIPVWGLTVQNEPMAKQKWESCIYTAADERDFVKKTLGPTLHREGLGNKKLIIWDHNRDLLFHRASTVLNDPDAAKYVWGTGFHWYETWTGSEPLFDNVKKVNDAFPGKHLLFTEGCKELFDPNKLNDWKLGEQYGHAMINDFNNGAVGWTDWNILLDEKGGPNHAGNFCFAPIHGNTKTGELTYTNAYYYIGQFSRFIHPDAIRIGCSTNRDKLSATSFLNTNGELVVIVLNLSNEKISYNLCMKGKAVKTVSLPHSIATFII